MMTSYCLQYICRKKTDQKAGEKMQHTFTLEQEHLLSLISYALWGTEKPSITAQEWPKVYQLMKAHSVTAIPVQQLSGYDIPTEIMVDVKKTVIAQIFHYQRIVGVQADLAKAFNQTGVGVAVLKGTSAAQYYPNPEFRTMGDIDLLAKPDDYAKTYQLLLDMQWHDVTKEGEELRGRHRTLTKKGISIELHHFFSSTANSQVSSNALDEHIFISIKNDGLLLDDAPNGLVLLNHILQHLNAGIGLRHIIDWMLFVDRCLDDTMWNSTFSELAVSCGLKDLAIAITRMCQLFMGLRTDNITWCKAADNDTCRMFMMYVINSGDFGRMRDITSSGALVKLPSAKHPIQMFRYVQSHGVQNWRALKKYQWLKPVAWIYQSLRYVRMIRSSHIDMHKLGEIASEAQFRKQLFDSVGLSFPVSEK